jgi:hypothetical protein
VDRGMPDLILPAGFERSLQTPSPFTLMAEQLLLDSEALQNVPLEAFYDRHMRLNLRHVIPSNPSRFFLDYPDNVQLTGQNFPEAIELFAISLKSIPNGETEIVFTPRQEPLLMQLSEGGVRVEAVVINGPEIFFSNWQPEFEHNGICLTLREFLSVKELRNQKSNLKKDSVATGTLALVRKDGSDIKPDEAFKAVGHFSRFLTFVRGAYCGVGHIAGEDQAGTTSFVHLGFTKSDQFHTATGWCDIGVVKALPEIYELYSKAVSVKADTKPLLTSIEFYRTSNIVRESSLEMAIVASHTALETLVPHLLSTKAGWSKNLLGQNLSFHDKLRAAVNFLGLVGDPLEHLPLMQARSKAESNADAFALLSIFRNRIIHQGKPFTYNGLELSEAWNLSQWLCEIFVFYYLGYRGVINDRRKYGGWRGGTVPVPLPALPMVK